MSDSYPEKTEILEFIGDPWHFLVLDGAEQSRLNWTAVQIDQFQGTGDSLLSHLIASQAKTVVLQYVGYGYSSGDGAPAWLPEALSKWQSSQPGLRIVIMFHETWARGKPWQRVYWQMGKQRECVKQLLELTAIAVTSTRANADSLVGLGLTTPIEIIPIGCSFSIEGKTELDWKSVLIFGKEQSRLRAVKTHIELIKKLAGSKLIERVVLAGQKESLDEGWDVKLVHEAAPKVKVETAYNFGLDMVPNIVQECGLALMYTQSTYLLKSTSFQLAAKLGQVAITSWEYDADPPFANGKHYLGYTKGRENSLLDTIADQVKLTNISSACRSAALDYLSWPKIALSWCHLLKRVNEGLYDT
jgi:hypothetical protein